eukprot:441572-Amphidinium_carterae.1
MELHSNKISFEVQSLSDMWKKFPCALVVRNFVAHALSSLKKLCNGVFSFTPSWFILPKQMENIRFVGSTPQKQSRDNLVREGKH